MTYVVTEDCIKCKHMDCVEVCPVDCFYEGDNMLVIHPDECIDCGVCEPECPPAAIVPDPAGKAQRVDAAFRRGRTIIPPMRTILALLSAALLAAGCASFDGRGLAPGQSTSGDVERVMGAPAERRQVGAETWFYYPRQPFGRKTF